jgi:hypothetical protein
MELLFVVMRFGILGYEKVTQDTETHNNKQELHQINVNNPT